MYRQFEKKTILIEMKIKDSSDNNPVINIKNDLIDLVHSYSSSCSFHVKKADDTEKENTNHDNLYDDIRGFVVGF